MTWISYDPTRRPPATLASPRDTWEQVKRERGWWQKPGETVAQMDIRLKTGLSPTEPPASYREYLQSAQWKVKRAEALQRAGHKCQHCAATRSLEVHHESYDRLGREWPRDLKVLCIRCHPHADSLREYHDGVSTFARKKYGDNWYSLVNYEDVAYEFDDWRERRAWS